MPGANHYNLVMDTCWRDGLFKEGISATWRIKTSSLVIVRRHNFVSRLLQVKTSTGAKTTPKIPKTLHVSQRRKLLFLFLRKFSQSVQYLLPVSTWYSKKAELARSLCLNCSICLSSPSLLQCLLSRAVRSSLLMRSIWDATGLYRGTELNISACGPS